jgi:putative membrane protein
MRSWSIAETTVSDQEGWKQLHILTIFVNLLPRTIFVIRGAWPLLLALLWSGSGDASRLINLGLIGFFFVATVGSTVRHWATLRYRVVDGRLEIRSGVLYRRVRAIDPARIQNVEFTRNLLHRMTNLVEVRIETASGNDVEGELSALTVGAAQELSKALEEARGEAAPIEEDEPEELLVVNDLVDLLRYGATANRLVALGAALGLGYEGLMSVMDPINVDDQVGALSTSLLVAGLLLLVSGVWLGGAVTAVLRHFGFKLALRRDRLVAREGLFTKRVVELPLSKVQVVTASEPMMRRWAGFGSILVRTAAARAGGGGTARAEARVPVVETEDLGRVMGLALPDLDADPWGADLAPPHPFALRRALFRAVVRSVAFTSVVWWLFGGWLGVVAGLSIPILVLFAVLDHRYQGWLVTDRVVIARRGYWHRRSVVVPRDKVQSVQIGAGPFLRRLGLGRVRLLVAGSSVSLPLIGWDRGQAIVEALMAPPIRPPVESVATGRASPLPLPALEADQWEVAGPEPETPSP